MRLGLDTETALISPYKQAPPLVCVSVSLGSRGEHLFSHDCADALAEILQHDHIVGHSIAYDMIVIAAEHRHLFPAIVKAYEEDRIACTEVRQKLIDIAAGVYRRFTNTAGKTVKIDYKLDSLAKRFLGKTLDKSTWRLRYGELRGVPIERWDPGAREYALEDARCALQIFEVQEVNAAYLKDSFRQARYAFWLKLMSAWGVRTDPDGIRKLARTTQLEIDLVRNCLVSAGLLRADGTRDTKKAMALCEQAYAEKGEPVPLTDGGKSGVQKPALDEKACKHSGNQLLKDYGRYGSLNTVMTSVIPGLNKPIIHTYYETILETGRTSSKDPNLQNMRTMPGVREIIVPRDGHVLVASDFGGLELYTLAETCLKLVGYSLLGDALNAGKDPHMMIASDILGIPVEQCNKKDHYEQRQTGKILNFGCGGGLGADALVEYAEANYQVILTKPQAKELKKIWLSRWVEMTDYFKYINSVYQGGIWQIYADRFRGSTTYTQACNTYFQGLGGDIAKSAGWDIMKACYVDTSSPLWGCRPILFVHDEFVLEVPEHRCHEAGLELPRLMTEASKPWVPHFPNGVKCETTAMRKYSKKAETKYVNGRLVPA